jgi:hypothetical protein
MLQVLAVDGPHDQALEHEADRARDERGRKRGEQEDGEVERKRVSARPFRQRQENEGRGIGAERDEGAVAEIEHVHHAEHKRKTGRHGENHHPHREPGRGQGHEGRERADERSGYERNEERRQRGQDLAPRPRQRPPNVSQAH